MAAELLKIKQKKMAFNNISRCNSVNTDTTSSSSNLAGSSQNLFSHHTESSLNKQKLKQNSKNEANQVLPSSNLKKSPSFSSLVKNNNEPTNSSSSLSNSSSSSIRSSVKASSTTKSSPSKQLKNNLGNSIGNTADTAEACSSS